MTNEERSFKECLLDLEDCQYENEILKGLLEAERAEAKGIWKEKAEDKRTLIKYAKDAARSDRLKAQNRWLQDELEKAKADLGARNRILTEEP